MVALDKYPGRLPSAGFVVLFVNFVGCTFNPSLKLARLQGSKAPRLHEAHSM